MKKKLGAMLFAVSMLLSIPFVAASLSSDVASVSAQTVTVKRKRRGGIARRTWRGGRWVVRRTWDGTKWVTRRVWVATKWTGRKSWKTGRKVVSRSKKIIY